MQKKYLALTLSAILATTLTGCGSDNDSNYTPPPATKPDTGVTTPDTGATTPDKDENKDKEKEPKPDKDKEKEPAKNPKPGDNPVNNAGDAANGGNYETNDYVVMQNYRRGKRSQFDQNNNPINEQNAGNASVVGLNPLTNIGLSNIVLARVKRPDGEKNYTTIYLGESPRDAADNRYSPNNNAGEVAGSLLDSTLTGVNGTTGDDPFTALQGLNDTDFNDSDLVANPVAVINPGTAPTAGVGKPGDANYQPPVPGTPATNVINPNRDYFGNPNVNGELSHKTGVLAIASVNGGKQGTNNFGIVGQEDQVVNVDSQTQAVTILDNTYLPTAGTNLDDTNNNDVRIFGTLYDEKDVPARVWDSVRQRYVANPAYNAITNNRYKRNSSWLTADRANAEVRNGIRQTSEETVAPNATHLNYVQYGRVSESVDIRALAQAIATQEDFFHATPAAKFRLVDSANGGPTLQAQLDDAGNQVIDNYFARGLEPTKDMPKSGKLQYLGHALMYGLDNSFHGGVRQGNDNTLVTFDRIATGNYVAAEVDIDKKTVDGKIYNVWTNSSLNAPRGAVEDNLVRFTGAINDTTNSVVGSAYRPYVAKDTKAAFKGAFFGPAAAEFGGSINSIDSGYGVAKWGGVFGAQKVGTPIQIEFENAVEEPQK